MADFSLTEFTEKLLNFDSKADAVSLKNIESKALLDLLTGLSNGETLIGKVMSVSDDSITFSTDNYSKPITIKTENGVSLKKGSVVMFEVNKYADNRVALRPLNTNVSSENTIKAAVTASGIPFNDKAFELTVRRMEYGLPIDRNSLAGAYLDVSKNMEMPVKCIVDLQALSVDVTKENLSAYENFLNMKNSFYESFKEMGDLFSEALFTDELSLGNLENIKNEENLQKADYPESVKEYFLNELSKVSKFCNALDKNACLPKLSFELSKLTEEVKDYFFESEKEDFSFENDNENKENVLEQKSLKTENKKSFLTEESLKEDIKELPKIVKEKVSNLFKEAFLDEFSLKKHEMESKIAIKDLYKKLIFENAKLTKAFEDVFTKDSPIVLKPSSVNSNIDFMNELNHIIPYVQIPFKSDNTNKTGELYVFKNKGSKTEKEGEVSAFIHLDTDNLGPTDVFVKLSLSKVTTNFTMDNEESLLFIEKNLSLLEGRFKEKGFDFNGKADLNLKTKSPIEIAIENSLFKLNVSNTSFDARI